LVRSVDHLAQFHLENSQAAVNRLAQNHGPRPAKNGGEPISFG
jgi:hypothetical protein